MKLVPLADQTHLFESHPSRGAWIEITGVSPFLAFGNVAPLTGCVD